MADTITVVGNIATAPERGSTTTGIATLSFRMATNHRRQDSTGAWVDASTNWFEVKAYRALAENAAASLSKGDAVIVTGRLRLREWENKEGRRNLSVEIDADSIGPDLRRGRGTFHRTAHPGSPEPADPETSGLAAVGATGGSGDAWATPGSEQVPY
jgi:single-strand DNA-binding protein